MKESLYIAIPLVGSINVDIGCERVLPTCPEWPQGAHALLDLMDDGEDMCTHPRECTQRHPTAMIDKQYSVACMLCGAWLGFYPVPSRSIGYPRTQKPSNTDPAWCWDCLRYLPPGAGFAQSLSHGNKHDWRCSDVQDCCKQAGARGMLR